MIIQCTTLAQIKDVIRINNITNNWDEDRLSESLIVSPLCIRLQDYCDCNDIEFYKANFPELPIVSYEEYIKTINPKKITLRHAIWDSTLIVQCITCKPFESVKKDGFELISSDSTTLYNNCAYLGCGDGNCNADIYHFNTPKEAHAYLDKLLELVELVNNPVPVVDLNKVDNYKLGNMTYLEVGDTFVAMLKKGKYVVEYKKKQLPIPLIKAQLEQILIHLAVKATITI